MQLLIVTETINEYSEGDIISVVPDTHVWGTAETVFAWVSAGRPAETFPTPAFSVLHIQNEPCDLNLMEPWVELDLIEGNGATQVIASRLWFVDLQAMPSDLRTDLRQAGEIISLPRSMRSVIKNKATGSSLPLRFEADGESKHRDERTSIKLTST